MNEAVNIFWFRRDLRLQDNAGLFEALESGLPIVPVFIFDRLILDQLENKQDARVEFIHTTICSLKKTLQSYQSDLEVFYDQPIEVFKKLIQVFPVRTVFSNEDYEPYATERDQKVQALLKENGITWKSVKDQVIFSKDEVLKDDFKPYTVFTPYSRKWKTLLESNSENYLRNFPSEELYVRLKNRTEPANTNPVPTLESMGFIPTGIKFPSSHPDTSIISGYDQQRDFPGMDATSHLGVHLRFGTISIRRLVAAAGTKSPVFLNELIWREFYQMILWHFPRIGKGRAFKPEYEKIKWRNDEKEFQRWCDGKTGYPMVDAGMHQLNQTGFMHNRVRMVTASFLTKHLLIDWRWGEAYFAEKLLDFELASNNGGWQWAAGSGCDAAPYFRIFNPQLQQKKFDPEGLYIRKWLPEFQELNYPEPMVEHRFARDRAIEEYKKGLISDC